MNSTFIRTNDFALHAVTNKIDRTNVVRMIFSIRTDLLLSVHTNASKFIRTNSFVLVCA